MNKLLIAFSLSINPSEMSPDDAAAYIASVDTRLRMMGYGSTETLPSSTATKAKTPLVSQWCAEKNVSRVRCTEGRTPEEQAEYNLRTYMGYTDDQINKILEDSQPEPQLDKPITVENEEETVHTEDDLI